MGLARDMSESLLAQIAPYDYYHELYQRYYVAGLQMYLEKHGKDVNFYSLQRLPALQRALGRIRYSAAIERLLGSRGEIVLRTLDQIPRLAGERRPLAGSFHKYVGQYTFGFNGNSVNVCIDAHDSGQLSSTQLVDWSTVYLKTNYWIGLSYPDQVSAFYNCNPLVLSHLGHLRGLRRARRKYDLCFVVRLWGGVNSVEKLEHNLRLIEAVSRFACRKYVLACLVVGDFEAIAKRLDRQGIPWTTSRVPIRKLWKISSESRINLIRLGVEDCIPWRMTDLMAMGGCPVFDQPPVTLWPEQLLEDEHYLSLQAITPPGQPLADDKAYAEIPSRLDAMLSSPMPERVRSGTSSYFDRFLHPLNIGRQIFEYAAKNGRAG